MTVSPSEWPTTRLGQVVDVLDSHRVPVSAKERARRPGSVPYYGAVGQVGTIDGKLFDEPLLLLGEDGVAFFDATKPKAYLIDGPAWVNNHVHVLRTRSIIDRRFLRYYLNQFDFRGYANGTTRLKLTQAAMRGIPVPVPELGVQGRIVEILEDHLSRLDAVQGAIDRAGHRLDRLRESSLMQVLECARQQPGTVVHTIGELATVSSGMTPARGNKSYYEGGTIPWITSGDLHQGLIQAASHFVTNRALEETTLKIVPRGTLLVAMYGEGKTRGTTAEVAIDATTNQACAAIQLHDGSLRAWVRAVLDANYSQLRRLAVGGVQPNLNLGLVRAIQVPLPPDDVRATSLARLDDMDAAATRFESVLERGRSQTARLRHSLLACAFSGRLGGAVSELDQVEEMARA